MLSVNISKEIRLVVDRIKATQDFLSYSALTTLVAYFLLNKRSVSQLVRDCPFSLSVSATCAAARKYKPGRLLRRIRKAVIKKYGPKLNAERFVFVIDDTKNPCYGKNRYAFGTWCSSSGMYQGQRVVCLALVDLKTKRKWPLGYSISNKTTELTAFDEAYSLVKEALDGGLPPLTVVVDTWYTSVDFIDKIRSLGCHFQGELKTNRQVKTNPGPNVPWVNVVQAHSKIKKELVESDWDSLSIQKKKRRRKKITQCHLQLKKSSKIYKSVAVYNNRRHRKAFAYYISTDKTRSGARIWRLSRARWSIECIFRTCKQSLSFGKLSVSGEEPSHLAVEMPLYLYGLLVTEPEKFESEENCSIDKILAELREQSMNNSIKVLISGAQTKSLEKLRGRRSVHNAHRKPTDAAAA